ncbi:trafficking protein particle complex subunit 11 [Cimex lectularius]|uniref:Trafficking protein particle complex subunit 11 n=1 Tax=Cimex lectularius TaxID=79782 RepID=A0A8I6R8M5_CIMLE|nr:trafficking protein particle complex subunit 11 [Cimex lectularius]
MLNLAERDFEFPVELLDRPKALIGIVGLDTANNAVHRATWDALRNDRRADESTVRFKLLPSNYEYPRPKPKKTSYEMHIPKGILKKSWMRKHLTLIPAVVCVFYNLEWDDPNWERKMAECESLVQSIRTALEEHKTQICVALIQLKASNLASEDPVVKDKVKQLLVITGINDKHLFILPHTEHLLDRTLILEKKLFEFAIQHYHEKIIQIQGHRDNLNKKTHQYLYVRHHFKMGFFSELEYQLTTARKYYREAYDSLLAVRLSDTNEFEVKTIAGFIGYKISRMEFALMKCDDAISHFKAHIDHYKHKTGPKMLLFQHHAWLAKQYSMFADLFEEMIQQGKPSSQTKHPGYFNKLAAKQSEQRKILAQELCANVHSYPNPDPLAGWEDLEFYGQRPWRPCKLSALDPALEQAGILALQYNEKLVEHSNIIIGLLGNAISQFKTFKCPKMRQNLVILMAEEYYKAKDYGKALTLLMHTFWDYRIEKWFLIANKLMVIAMASAYLTASITEYARLCLDVISRPTTDDNDVSRALNNLIILTKGGIPEPEPELNPNEVEMARGLWMTAKADELILVDTSVFTCPVQCKIVFGRHDYNCVEIHVVLRSNIPQPFTFTKLMITTLGSGSHNLNHVVATQLNFNYGEVKTFTYSFVPNFHDVGKPLQVSAVLLNIGDIEGKTVCLKFNGFGRDSISFHPELLYFKQISGSEGEFLKLKPQLTCTILRRVAQVQAEIKHSPPALLNECYPLRLSITNNESSPVTKSRLTISFPHNINKEVIHTSNFQVEGSSNLIPLPLSLELGELGHITEKCFYMKCRSLDNRILDVRLDYYIDGHFCVTESQIHFNIKKPFEINTKYMSANFDELEELYTKEPFLIQPQIVSSSPWPITIHSTSVHLSKFMQLEGTYECLLKNCELEFENTASELICASAKSFSNDPVVIATFTVEWARSEENVTTSVSCVLPEKKIIDIPISVVVDAPATGIIKSQYVVKYFITNHSSKLHIVEIYVEPSNEFTFAGINKMRLFLLPESTKELEYQMYPLCCGTASLPYLKISAVKDSIVPNLEKVVLRALPANIFIMPEGKKNKGNQLQLPSHNI